ncbi:hypothetical protein PLESTB_001551600 [Pleodorina starrii]|uniref:Kazal-like domain-containing protein n=1 Tax=Pleodorina starrii TaxID=330485 RepID=A0A9W6F8P7_9CHLO|nr:hypothetical protein PLESTB_001551600 [Pleodorina starrii]
MGHRTFEIESPARRSPQPALRALTAAAVLAALAAQACASQGTSPGLSQPQLDLSAATGRPAAASAPAAPNLRPASPGTNITDAINELADVLRTGASNISAQAARVQSGVVNATANLFREILGGGQASYDEYGIPLPTSGAITLDDAQRCASCPADSQPVCCRRRATYANACRAIACFGEVPSSCAAGSCKPLAGLPGLTPADGLTSVLGPQPGPASVSVSVSGSAVGVSTTVGKGSGDGVAAVTAFDGPMDGAEPDGAAAGGGRAAGGGGEGRGGGRLSGGGAQWRSRDGWRRRGGCDASGGEDADGTVAERDCWAGIYGGGGASVGA